MSDFPKKYKDCVTHDFGVSAQAVVQYIIKELEMWSREDENVLQDESICRLQQTPQTYSSSMLQLRLLTYTYIPFLTLLTASF